MGTLPLSTLLFGQPLTRRGEDVDAEVAALGQSLDCVLDGVLDLLGRETGETEEEKEAKAQAMEEQLRAVDADFLNMIKEAEDDEATAAAEE